jgi:hypothetical protein
MASRSRHFLWRLAAILAEFPRQVTFSIESRLSAFDKSIHSSISLAIVICICTSAGRCTHTAGSCTHTHTCADGHGCFVLAEDLLLSTVLAPRCMEAVGTCPKKAIRVLIFPMCLSQLTCCLLWLTSMMTIQAVAAGIKLY